MLLIRCCKAMGIKYRRVPLDQKTRWSSTARMIRIWRGLIEAVQSVQATQTFDSSLKKLNLDDNDWEVLNDISQFFEVFARATEIAQGDKYPTLQRTVPEYITILRQLKAFCSPYYASELRSAAKAAYKVMHEYYQKTLTRRAACVATIIDPRYKDQIFTWFEDSGGDSMRMYKKAIDRFKETYNRYRTRASEINTFERLNQEEETREKEERDPQDWRDPFFEFEDKRAHAVKPELERYLEEPLIPRDLKTSHLDVWKYWQSKQFEFPILAQIARDFLAIPASSAASERVFSQGGDLITKKRNRIGGTNTRYVLCLRSWGVYCDDDDFDEIEEQKEGREIKEEETGKLVEEGDDWEEVDDAVRVDES